MKERILVVDDEEAIQVTLCGILEREGFCPDSAATVGEALRQLAAQSYDALVLDLMVGDGDGFEILARARETTPDLPVVILTGFGSIESAARAVRLGASDYLTKPCKVDELRAALSRGLARREEVRARLRQIAGEPMPLPAGEDAGRERAGELVEQRMAESGLAARQDEFLSVAAHELKTPLTGILGHAQLLRRSLDRGSSLDPDKLRRQLDIIVGQAAKLASLINQLLDTSRIQAGTLVLERTSTDVVALVEHVASAFRVQTDRHAIAVQAVDPVVASVDPLRLEQVLANLLDNAIKFSPAGGPIEIEVSRTSPDGFAIVVTDHGIGIPRDRREHLFDPYFQAHQSSHLSGLGLGLYLSHQIITRHGGTLVADFPVEGGTRFIARIPDEC